MRVARLYTIDVEIVERLKGEENASELINSLLRNYFQEDTPIENLKDVEAKLDELKDEKQVLEGKVEVEKKRIESTAKMEEGIKELELPELVIKWIKLQPQCPSPVSIARFLSDIDIQPSEKMREKIKKAWE